MPFGAKVALPVVRLGALETEGVGGLHPALQLLSDRWPLAGERPGGGTWSSPSDQNEPNWLSGIRWPRPRVSRGDDSSGQPAG